jgi:hypothetical protein
MKLNYVELLVGYCIYILTPYMTEIALYFLQRFGISRYVLYGDKDNYKKIIRLIEKQTRSTSLSYRNGKVQPAGYFYGPRCLGVYTQESRYADEEKVVMITTTEYYNSLIKTVENGAVDSCASSGSSSSCSNGSDLDLPKEDVETNPLIDEDKPVKKVKETVNVYIRSGTYKNFFYKKLSKDVSHITPFKTQEPIVDDIIRQYKKKERLAVFIHGVSMAGKSTIGYLVAKALKANYTHSFNPSDPGDTFDNMIGDVNHGEDSATSDDEQPIVIVLEEADIIIDSIHKQDIKRHADIPTPVHNKTTWNNFLNDLVFYNKIIVILTSNSSKEDIDKLDPSYLNHGRIDATYSMMEPLYNS